MAHAGAFVQRNAGAPAGGDEVRDCQPWAGLGQEGGWIVLNGALKDWFEACGLQVHLSVTDESDYAASFCVVETKAA